MHNNKIIWIIMAITGCWAYNVLPPSTKTISATTAIHTYDLHWPLTPLNVTRIEHYQSVENGVSIITTNVTSLEPVTGVSTDVVKRASADLALILTSFAQSAWVASATICIIGGLATAGVACYAAIGTAVLSTIWGLFIVSVDLPGVLSNRAEHNIVWELHHDFDAASSCDTRCQLESKSGHATWTHFANVTVNGQKHMMHYWQKDSLRGIRAQQLQDNLIKRAPRPQETIYVETGFAQEGQLISTVYWVSDSEQAKDELSSDDLQTISDDFANYVVDNSMSMGCLDVGDSDGTVFQSVVLLDDSDDVWELSQDDILPTLNTCYVQDPYSTAPQ